MGWKDGDVLFRDVDSDSNSSLIALILSCIDGMQEGKKVSMSDTILRREELKISDTVGGGTD
jgi:hypothetical protein